MDKTSFFYIIKKYFCGHISLFTINDTRFCNDCQVENSGICYTLFDKTKKTAPILVKKWWQLKLR